MGTQWSPNRMPFFGQFFDNPQEMQMRQNLHRASQAYDAYRPEVNAAQQAAMRQQLSTFQPMNAALGQMYGPTAQFDLQGASQSPVSQRMQGIGRPSPYDFDTEAKRSQELSNLGMGMLAGGPIGAGFAAAHNKRIENKEKKNKKGK